ncbi:hypothetical protein TrST_g10976 [Triparma strigata]|uniref:Uncharacterized protein n=1 Tax=Triparma strigata TaxID=1606541 RepID=A0A9W7BYN8_9STRA|nr:hypothetical protein TrST_g10976 [Triparma strigata]
MNVPDSIDSVSLIPSVSSFYAAATNSGSLAIVLERSGKITAALATIDWSKSPEDDCMIAEVCDEFTGCDDLKDETECKNFDANMGTFNPHARCYWWTDGTTGYCEENSYYEEGKFDYAQTCNHHSVQTVCGPDAPMNADDMKTFNDGLKGLSKRFSDIAKTTMDKRTEKNPPSAFDFMGYLAEELGNDWGV